MSLESFESKIRRHFKGFGRVRFRSEDGMHTAFFQKAEVIVTGLTSSEFITANWGDGHIAMAILH